MGVDMNEVVMLRGAEPRKILETAIEEEVPAIMTYLSKGKWHVTKVLLTNLGANRLSIKLWPKEKPHPINPVSNSENRAKPQNGTISNGINIHVNQPVGVSLKYGYGKFVFDTTVVGLEPSPSALSAERHLPQGILRTADCESKSGDRRQSGTIVLALPDRIEIVQRRSYFRVDVPKSLKVNVLLWHRGLNRVPEPVTCEPDEGQGTRDEGQNYWQGRLVDISAGGAQIAVDTAQKPDLKKGQFIGLTFTPMPYEKPLILDAQIRNILPTADGKNICLGLQIVGLEASPEGRGVLQRLCNVVERYFQINQSGAKQQEMNGAPNAINPVRNSENRAKPQKGTI